jgi:hypothetical protein
MIDRPLIYVASAFRGKEMHNTRRAVEVGQRLRSYGADVCIPHLSALEDVIFPQSDEYWLGVTMRQCVRCDAVYRIDGPSVGADAEVAEMVRLGRPVLYTEASAADWIRDWCERHKAGVGNPLPPSEVLP